MVNSYQEMMGTPQDVEEHSAYNKPDATQKYAGDVIPLHPPGTFLKNTQMGDVVNGVAKSLGVSPPNNVTRFPK